MKTVRLHELTGDFAGDKDVARNIRETELLPALREGGKIALDFAGVSGATQSFVHALISEAIRQHGGEALDRIEFKNCNETVRKVVTIVVEYTQESF